MAQDTSSRPNVEGKTRNENLTGSPLSLQLLAFSPWSAALLHTDGRIRAINSIALDLFGLPEDADLENRPLTSLWPADSAALIKTAIERAGKGLNVTETAYCPSGRGVPRWIEVTLAPVKEATDASPTWLLCSLRDATQLNTMQESLKVSEQRFRALADNIAQLAWMADSKGSIFWYNKRWFDFTGTRMADMEEGGWQRVHHPDHIERVVQKWKANIKSGQVWEDTFPLRGANGVYRWFLSRAMPIRDHTEAIVLWCGTNTDITEQRLATHRLRQKARLIEMSHEAIFSWDHEGTIVSWNRGCQELYGYTQSEAIGRVSHELLRSQHPVPLEEIVSTLKEEKAWSGEILHFAKDGTKVWVDSRHELITVGGQRLVLETNRDITERRKADEVRNMLVAELNHRVKNTLAIVQSIAGQTARSSASVDQFVASFRGRLHSLANAHNVLTDAHWYGADLRNLVNSQLAVTLGSTQNVRVQGDDVFLSPQSALQFTLVLHELASNAVKYGSLSCPSGRVEISWKRMGTKGETLDFVWRESGGPAVSSPQRRGFGTLLIERSGGLPHMSTSLKFDPAGVECHIEANLDDDVLSESVMFNPIRKEAPLLIHPRTKHATPHIGNRRNILVIEDDPLTALEIEDTLAEEGYRPIGPATAVASAVEAINRGGIDAVIVDGELLGASAARVRQKLDQDGVPYVYISDQLLSTDDISPNMRAIRRPIRNAQLIELLAELLGPQESRSP